MPIKYWIDAENERVMAEVSGTFSLTEILEVINKAVNDPQFKPGFNIFSDHRRIEKAITTDQLKRTTHHLVGLSQLFSGAKWAVIVGKDVSYGMMNMMSVYLKKIPIDMRPFYTLNEAEEWLAEQKDPPNKAL